MSKRTHYEVLGVAIDADFSALKRAYYRQAKRCHPDTNPHDPKLEEMFKRLVDAFDTLSDPKRRALYDERLEIVRDDEPPVDPFASSADDEDSIMDTAADDLLEELVTGNIMPRDTHLSRFFQDLQSTEVFMTFREAKNLCWRNETYAAWGLLQKALEHSPMNILYHYYAARTAIRIGRHREAKRHFRTAIELGEHRDPELALMRIRREYAIFLRTRSTWFSRLLRWLHPLPSPPELSPEEAMHRELQRAVTRNLKSRKPPKPKALK